MLSGKKAVGRPRGRTRALLALLAALLAALWAAAAAASPPTSIPTTSLHRIPPARQPLSACVARMRAGDTPAVLIAQPGRFDCATPSSRFGTGDYWLRLTPVGGSTRLPLLSITPGWQARASLTALHADGSAATVTIDNHTLSAFAALGPRLVVPLPGDASPVTMVLMRLDQAVNATGLINGAQFTNIQASTAQSGNEIGIYASFGGLCLALLAYNVALWISIRERFQLTYCAMLFGMLLYGWSTSGAMAQVAPEADLTISFRLAYPALALVTNLSLRFFVSFLEPDILPRWLRLLMQWLSAGLLVAGLLVAVAPFGLIAALDRVYAALFLPVPVVGAALAVVALRQHGPAIRVLLVAWLAPVTMTVLRLANAFNLVECNTLVMHSAVVAMSCAALLGALAIASRVKLLVEERDMARAEERLARRLADIDPLTGLLNRRALLDGALGWQSPEPLRLLLLDIDHFKRINDTYGHDMGDAVLRELANLLAERSALRASIARIGGEEFALVGTAAELSPALALAILADVRAHRFPGRIQVTVSIGMAEGMVRDEDGWRTLYREADTALYAAKAQGRNRAVDRAAQTLPENALTPLPSPPAQESRQAG